MTPNDIAKTVALKIVNAGSEYKEQEDEIRYGIEWLVSGLIQVSIVLILAFFF